MTFGTGDVAVCVCKGFIAAVNLIVFAAAGVSAAAVSCPADTLGIRELGVPSGTEREGRAILTVASSEASFAVAGAGIGAGIYKDNTEAFATLEKLAVINPARQDEYTQAYELWKSRM